MIQNDDTPEMIVYKLRFLGLIITFSALFWWAGAGNFSMIFGLFSGVCVLYFQRKKEIAAEKLSGGNAE
jgi:hypothetical protein